MTSSQTSSTTDDLDLIASAQLGDRQAFSELVTRHQKGVITVVYRLCGDARLAEDAAQEAFVRVWQNLKKYNPQYAFRSWLYRIATNAALDVLRRERPSVEIDALPLADKTPTLEQSAESGERASRVQQAITHLSEPLRLVLVLREYEELSYQEISAALDIPVGTVMSRLNSARIQLRRELTGLMESL